jgi:hypothetical protein
MGAAMQLYAGFALLVIAIVAIIVVAALLSNLIGAIRRRFGKTRAVGKTRAHDAFSKPASSSHPAPCASRSEEPASRSNGPLAPR